MMGMDELNCRVIDQSEFPIIYQRSFHDCGLACLNIIACYYDKQCQAVADENIEDMVKVWGLIQ